MTKKDWATRGIEPVKGASRVTAFQMLLWSRLEEWSSGWSGCLDYIDRLHEPKVTPRPPFDYLASLAKEFLITRVLTIPYNQIEEIDDSDPSSLDALMFDPDGVLAREYFVMANLLKIFHRHMDVLPRSLQQMKAKWEQIYPGVDSDLTHRFAEDTQLTLLKNWTRLTDHVDELHRKLVERVEKRSAELLNLRDSVSSHRSMGRPIRGGTCDVAYMLQLMIARGFTGAGSDGVHVIVRQ